MTFDELIAQIRSHEGTSASIKKWSPVTSLTSINGTDQSATTFNYLDGSVDFIECFLRIPSSEMEKDEFIKHCMTEYESSAFELALIREFKQTYTSERAVKWYTRNSSISKILGQALIKANISLLFLCRFFIRDIYHQLKQNQYQSPIRVYRGKCLPEDTVSQIKSSVGGLYTMNSFLSATDTREHALSGIGSPSKNWEKVLFEIDADPRYASVKPFAEVTSLSYFPGEWEMLFMAGSTFLIHDVHCDDKNVWVVKMTLSAGNEPDWQTFFKHMQEIENEDGNLTIASFGKILHQMGKFTEAEKYYQCLLAEMHPDQSILGTVYRELAEIASSKGDLDAVQHWNEKLVEIGMEILAIEYEKPPSDTGKIY